MSHNSVEVEFKNKHDVLIQTSKVEWILNSLYPVIHLEQTSTMADFSRNMSSQFISVNKDDFIILI
jgi:hypothetical protein